MSLPWPPRCWLHPLPDRHSSPSARVFAEIIAAADIAGGCGVLAGVVAGPRVLVLHPPRLVGNETAEYPMLVVLTERQVLIRSAFFGALACSPPGTPPAGGDLT
jgi:hypothetical protein